MLDNKINQTRFAVGYFMFLNTTFLKSYFLIKVLLILLISNALALSADAIEVKNHKSNSRLKIVSDTITRHRELIPDLSNWLQSPNGGEVYFRGGSIQVNINASVYNTNQAISIELYYGDTKVGGTNTGGMTNRSISTSGLPASSNYKIRIYVANYPDQEDWSNNTFSLVTSGYAGPCAAPMGSDVKGCTSGSELYLSVSNTETDSHICGKTISHKWYTSVNGTNTVPATVESTGTCAAYSTSVRVTSTSSYWVSSVIDGCESERTLITAKYLDQSIDVPSNGTASRCTPGSIALSATPGANGNSINWYTNQAAVPGTTDIPFKMGVSVSIPDLDPTNVKIYYASSYNNSYKCESTRVPVTAIITTLPEIPTNKNFIFCILEQKEVSAVPSGNIVNYNWYDNSGTFLKQGLTYALPIDDEMPIQIPNLQLESISKDNCPSTSRASISIQVTQDCDDQLNSIESISYDPRDNTNIIGHSKSYFDLTGKPLQTQSKSFENPSDPNTPLIFASQALQDNLGRDALSTLSAPTFKPDFQYDHFFIRSSATTRYNPDDFDTETTKNNPVPVNDDVKGTLGWYYSHNNNVEKKVPVTDFPYSRTDFYDDGFGEVRKNAGAGDQFRLGKNHEILSGTFPVYSELDDYVSKRGLGAIRFQNENFEGMGQWESFNPFPETGNEPFQTYHHDEVRADGSSSGYANTTLIGQKRPNGVKWPAGNYKISIVARNQSSYVPGSTRSSLKIWASDNPNETAALLQFRSDGDGFLPANGTIYTLDVEFSLAQDFNYLLFSFVKDGTTTGYNVLIYLNQAHITSFNGQPQNAPLTLAANGIQSVIKDSNGQYSISMTDKSGKNVMSARSGNSTDYTMKVHNVVTANSSVLSSDYKKYLYFYLLNDQSITLTKELNTFYYIEDLLKNTTIYNSEDAIQPTIWPAGFYRVVLNAGVMSIDYTNYFLDIAYQFYDDAGRLKTSLSPNGFNQLKDGVAITAVDKTTYVYNHQGWLLSMTEPDAGTTKYLYRRDGSIRFSQNEKQRSAGTFSYTNYDDLGRPVESGEYVGNSLIFYGVNDPLFSSSLLKGQLEYTFPIKDQQDATAFAASWGIGTTKDWVRTNYDLPYTDTDLSIPNLPVQDFVRGAVSWSENENIKTVYSYDEFGHVTYMVQKPKALTTRIFCVQYQYDLLGNVLMVSNLGYRNSVLTSEFYHHYEYDKNQRLKQAFTSVEPDGEKKLRATYEYYLHGPLKRIVLGDNLQGIDFVYNINGWLTQINHPDNNQDPGQDGNGNGVRKDVFGMVLDYYESDLNNLFTTSTGSVHDPARRHRLPFANEATVASNQQPLIRFKSPAIYNDENLVPFKSFGAQSPAYKNMLQSKKEN